MSRKFVGVDLGWSERNRSGLAVAEWTGARAVVEPVIGGVPGNESVVSMIEQLPGETIVVAIDAPLIIRNDSGQRPCETEVSRRFGKFHASAHSSNLKRYPDPAPCRLAAMLEQRGFLHGAPNEPRLGGRWFFEVYPHPAQVVLFGLDRILKYKQGKGRTRETRLAELARLRQFLAGLRDGVPALWPGAAGEALLNEPLSGLRGRALKDHEDALDAWFCAYLALYGWYWGRHRNETIGDFESGYIVVPREIES